MTVIEKVARAICCHRNGEQSPCQAQVPDSPFTVCQARTFKDDARAALEALRDQCEHEEMIAIKAGAVIHVDAVLAIECVRSWLTAALNEPAS